MHCTTMIHMVLARQLWLTSKKNSLQTELQELNSIPIYIIDHDENRTLHIHMSEQCIIMRE